MASNISVDEAKQIVRRATKRWGHLSEEMMNDIEQWKPEYRREIDENWLSLENAASHSVKTSVLSYYFKASY
jgi:gas vesicle protein